MAISISISITQNSQNIANNTSNVTVAVNAKWTYGSYNKLQKSGSLTIDGTKYTFTSSFNTGQSTSGSQQLFSKTVNITHTSDGSKTLSCSASYTSGVSSGTVSASASKTLTTIPRKSTLSVGNGTLDTTQTLTVTRQSTSFTHTITATCGSQSSTICTKSTSTSISFTPPQEWAAENQTGTSVPVVYTITTYNGSTDLGSNSYTKSCAIPEFLKPVVLTNYVDATSYYKTYGGYVKGYSKLHIILQAVPTYAQIKTYSTTVDGVTYTGQDFISSELKTAGIVTISTKVTDTRNRVGTDTDTINVLDYSVPTISLLKVKRCNADGTENGVGEYVQVTFSAAVTSINNKNTASYTLEYKKTSENRYTSVELSDYTNNYAPTEASYIFPADSGSSYSVRLTVTDGLDTTTKTTKVSTGFTLMHWLSSGLGIALGKIAELTNVLDIGFQTRFYGGILPPVLEAGTDLNDVRTPNTYTGANISHYSYENCPVSSGTFTLLVESCGEDGQVKQTYSSCSKYKPERYSRFFYQGEWGAWFWANTDEYILFESESESGEAEGIHLAASASHFRYIEIYFTDNNGKTGGYTKVFNPNKKTVCLQISEPYSTIYSRQTTYNINGTFMLPDNETASYFRVNADTTITTKFGENFIRILRVVGRA